MTEIDTTDEAPVYEKGSWQEALQKSSTRLDQSAKAKKAAGALLWRGAKEGIEAWLPTSKTDVNGEGLYADVIEALGRSQKGSASKIKTVAVAVRTKSLDLSAYSSLASAYAEATRLTKTATEQKKEDDAADKAVESIEAPKTASSVDGAALILLSKGIDGAVVAILDALGEKNEDAHKAFVRAVATEVSARIKANKPQPAPKKTTAEANKAKRAKPAKKAAAPVKSAGTKAKPVARKTAAKKAAAPAPVDEGSSIDDLDFEDETVETPAPAKKAVARKPRPVRRQR